MRRHRRNGFSLVELIVAIVIISVAVGGVLLVFTVAATHSADPLEYEQAIAIAEGYLDEILARSYEDPDGVTEADRAQFDDVSDYGAIDNEPPRDQDGAAISDLGNYRVRVRVTATTIGPALKAVNAKHIEVQVVTPSCALQADPYAEGGCALLLSAWKVQEP